MNKPWNITKYLRFAGTKSKPLRFVQSISPLFWILKRETCVPISVSGVHGPVMKYLTNWQSQIASLAITTRTVLVVLVHRREACYSIHSHNLFCHLVPAMCLHVSHTHSLSYSLCFSLLLSPSHLSLSFSPLHPPPPHSLHRSTPTHTQTFISAV